MTVWRIVVLGILAVVSLPPSATAVVPAADTPAEARQEGVKQARKAATVFTEIMRIRDNGIPEELLRDAECIAVFPDVFKAAFIFGGSGGKGVATCRDPKTGRWGPPVFLKVGGGSWGAQIGAESADFVLFGMNRDARNIFTKEEWTVGAEASVAAGPVGRKAKAGTDWKLDSQWVSYSRTKGLFAGISLDGSKVKLDDDVNAAIYGAEAKALPILMGQAPMHGDAKAISVFPETVGRYSRARARR